jgi:hypothetical protein
MLFPKIKLCMFAIVLGVAAEPEAAAEPQYYSKPAYPAPYGQQYKSEYDYCDSRKAPKCAKTGTETFCLKDTEYPEKEVKVRLLIVLTFLSTCLNYCLCFIYCYSVRRRLRPVDVEEIRRCC